MEAMLQSFSSFRGYFKGSNVGSGAEEGSESSNVPDAILVDKFAKVYAPAGDSKPHGFKYAARVHLKSLPSKTLVKADLVLTEKTLHFCRDGEALRQVPLKDIDKLYSEAPASPRTPTSPNKRAQTFHIGIQTQDGSFLDVSQLKKYCRLQTSRDFVAILLALVESEQGAVMATLGSLADFKKDFQTRAAQSAMDPVSETPTSYEAGLSNASFHQSSLPSDQGRQHGGGRVTGDITWPIDSSAPVTAADTSRMTNSSNAHMKGTTMTVDSDVSRVQSTQLSPATSPVQTPVVVQSVGFPAQTSHPSPAQPVPGSRGHLAPLVAATGPEGPGTPATPIPRQPSRLRASSRTRSKAFVQQPNGQIVGNQAADGEERVGCAPQQPEGHSPPQHQHHQYHQQPHVHFAPEPAYAMQPPYPAMYAVQYTPPHMPAHPVPEVFDEVMQVAGGGNAPPAPRVEVVCRQCGLPPANDGDKFCVRCGSAVVDRIVAASSPSRLAPVLSQVVDIKTQVKGLGDVEAEDVEDVTRCIEVLQLADAHGLGGGSFKNAQRLIQRQRDALTFLRGYAERQALDTTEKRHRLDSMLLALADDDSSISDTTLLLGSSTASLSSASDAASSASDQELMASGTKKRVTIVDPGEPTVAAAVASSREHGGGDAGAEGGGGGEKRERGGARRAKDKVTPPASKEQKQEIVKLRSQIEAYTKGTYLEHLRSETEQLQVKYHQLRRWARKTRRTQRDKNRNLRAWVDSQTRITTQHGAAARPDPTEAQPTALGKVLMTPPGVRRPTDPLRVPVPYVDSELGSDPSSVTETDPSEDRYVPAQTTQAPPKQAPGSPAKARKKRGRGGSPPHHHAAPSPAPSPSPWRETVPSPPTRPLPRTKGSAPHAPSQVGKVLVPRPYSVASNASDRQPSHSGLSSQRTAPTQTQQPPSYWDGVREGYRLAQGLAPSTGSQVPDLWGDRVPQAMQGKGAPAKPPPAAPQSMFSPEMPPKAPLSSFRPEAPEVRSMATSVEGSRSLAASQRASAMTTTAELLKAPPSTVTSVGGSRGLAGSQRASLVTTQSIAKSQSFLHVDGDDGGSRDEPVAVGAAKGSMLVSELSSTPDVPLEDLAAGAEVTTAAIPQVASFERLISPEAQVGTGRRVSSSYSLKAMSHTERIPSVHNGPPTRLDDAAPEVRPDAASVPSVSSAPLFRMAGSEKRGSTVSFRIAGRR